MRSAGIRGISLLFAVVAGLLLGPVAPAAVLAAAVAGRHAGRARRRWRSRRSSPCWRALRSRRRALAALGAGVLPTLAGHEIDARAVLLEPVRQWRSGTAVARVRLLGTATLIARAIAVARASHDLAGEVAVARSRCRAATAGAAGRQRAEAARDSGAARPVRGLPAAARRARRGGGQLVGRDRTRARRARRCARLGAGARGARARRRARAPRGRAAARHGAGPGRGDRRRRPRSTSSAPASRICSP